jgi:hypothetical protein
MEEDVLKIIMNAPFQKGEQRIAAKEITEHIFEFIEWLHDNTDDTRNPHDYKLWWLIPYENYISIEEVYQCWIREVKKIV